MALEVAPGEEILIGGSVARRELHELFGGQTQSGISPSARAPIVMLFSDPASGERHGYFDGEQPDGFFHYSGEGQRGDQEMKRGNKAIANHVADGRALHLFLGRGKGKPVTYAGEFEYVDHYETDAPETGDGPIRKVLMFRLRPTHGEALRTPSSLIVASETVLASVPVEQHLTERAFVEPSREPYEAERREAALVQQYEAYLRAGGSRPYRSRIQPAGELKPLFTDLFDPETNTLIEAKGTTTREAMRMAIGQLLDYRRFLPDQPSLAVLVPSVPRADLLDLLGTYGVSAIFPTNDGFETIKRSPTRS